MAYIKKIWKEYPDTTTQIKAVDLNKMDKGIYELTTGWISADETWTYSSVDDPTGVITIVGDKTGKYSLGMRIKFTNNSNVIYGIITKISYSSPNTTLTFLHEINPSNSLALHLMANSAITNNYYSNMKVPFGFPISPDSWSVKLIDTSTPTQNTPTQNTWYNLGTLSISLPIGVWCTRYDAQTEHERATAGYPSVFCALSTSNSSVSDVDLQTQGYFYSASVCSLVLSRDKVLSITSKTTYYLVAKTDQTNCTALKFRGGLSSTKIKAICAYL